jgi:Flp pilus assembly protein TadG
VKRQQRGLAAVEFAMVGAVAMTLLFGAIETGRTLFVLSAANEATRRAARVAVVSTEAAAKADATAAYAGTLNGLTEDHIDITYYDVAGAVAVTPAERAFVTVRLLDYTHSLFIPGLPLTIAVPEFPTTLPVESQGIDPD